MACAQGYRDLVHILMANKANSRLENFDEMVPAEMTKDPEVLNLLLTGACSTPSTERPVSFSGNVQFVSPLRVHDMSVFIVLNSSDGFFSHYNSRADYMQNNKPALRVSLNSIASARPKQLGDKFFFIIHTKKHTLKYYTFYSEMTATWCEVVAASIGFFQNNGKVPELNEPDTTLDRASLIEENGVNLDTFKYIRGLGQGSFGIVSLVLNKADGLQYALKALNKAALQRCNQLKYAVAECKLLSGTAHPFIIPLHWVFQTKEKLFMVLEFCPNGDLSGLLQSQGRLTEPQAKFYISQIILALEFLHSKGIVYRDLKPQNILLDRFGYVRLADFGLAIECENELNPAMTFCGSPAYLPPEVLLHKGVWKPADVYSTGATLYELLTGQPPFYTEDIFVLYERIQAAALPLPNELSEEAKDLLSLLLAREPEARPSIVAVKRHSFFSDIDWDLISSKTAKSPLCK